VVARHFAVFRAEHDHRILCLAGLLEVVEDLPQPHVQVLDQRVIGGLDRAGAEAFRGLRRQLRRTVWWHRPENIVLSSTAGKWKGRVHMVEHLGNDTLVHLETVIGPLIVRAGREAAALPRDEVFATPDEKMLHVFKNGRRVSA